MPDKPKWYTQLKWSRPTVAVNALQEIPTQPGCYVFTEDPGPLVPGRVLYVGKADNLKTRLRGYLVNYHKAARTPHKGRAFLFHHRETRGDSSLYVRWAVYGDPAGIEGDLIEFLEPAFNSRWEEANLADDEGLDPRFSP